MGENHTNKAFTLYHLLLLLKMAPDLLHLAQHLFFELLISFLDYVLSSLYCPENV